MRVADLTGAQLVELFKQSCSLQGSQPAPVEVTPAPGPGPRFVYGLRGIQELFHCSNVTAQRYKRGIIKDAVQQYGRKIIVDVDKALALFSAAKEQPAA